MSKRFSKKEDDLIKEKFPTEPISVLIDLLGRCKSSIRGRAKVLGVRRAKDVHWTKEEDDLIKEFYPEGGTALLVKKINRSTTSIHSRASKLRVSISKDLDANLRRINFRKSYTGTQYIPGTYISRLKLRATEHDFEYTVSNEYLNDLFVKQNFKCALSGIDIHFKEYGDYTASLDRIDSSRGYIEGNVQWVHKDINFMKSDFSLEEFLNYCSHVVTYNSRLYLSK